MKKDMKATRIDALNKVLTNTLEYKAFLTEMAKANYDAETRKKLKEFAQVREKQGHDLLKIISKCGGNVETSQGQTDQPSISWIAQPSLDSTEILPLLKTLIKSEQKSLEDYKILLEEFGFDSDCESLLKKHRSEGETTLQYIEVARETVERSA